MSALVIVSLKQTRILPDQPVEAGKKYANGLELWEAEFDGHPSLEIRQEIPPHINRMKNSKNRAKKIEALVRAQAEAYAKAKKEVYL